MAGALEPPVQVSATDRFGNPVPGVALRATVSAGTVTGAYATTDGAGIATFANLHFADPGTVRLRVSGGGAHPKTSAPFVVYPAVTVTSLSPPTGPKAGGNTVTVTGANLAGATAVDFGGTAGTDVDVLTPTELTVTAPRDVSGRVVDVTVATPDGTSGRTPADRYTYVPAPTVSGVSPPTGRRAGGNTVTVTGANLTGATAVDFGKTAGTDVDVLSPTELTVTAPKDVTGSVVDVTVTTPDGTSGRTPADQYTYVRALAVARTGPSTGPRAGGASITHTDVA
jgi:hypothetical protein